jgi:hypothetical protein
MTEGPRCPKCAAPTVPLDTLGKVARHTRWRMTDMGPRRLRTFCIASEGMDPL